MIKTLKILATVFFVLATFSCATTNVHEKSFMENPEENEKNQDTEDAKEQKSNEEKIPPKSVEKISEISMVFAGDIMAHSTNYKTGNFGAIWKYVADFVSSTDLSFGNIEAPVDNTKDWANYPAFNMKQSYVEAAIDAGFNVFSLSNNHTNDQGQKSIAETKKYFDNRENIWSSGVKDSSNDGLNYTLIEKTAEDGSQWKVLFVAVTEVLNSYVASGYVNFYPPSKSKRDSLKESLKQIAQENQHDLFVFSIHCSEPEYILAVTEDHKNFYRELIKECGVDIVWSNHPHVTKEWEKLTDDEKREDNRDAFIMYANGNTISGQRYAPKFTNPESGDENVGDGVMIKVVAKKKELDGQFQNMSFEIEPKFITTYITPGKQYVIRFLDDDFIRSLDMAGVNNWRDYMKSRKRVMERILEKSVY